MSLIQEWLTANYPNMALPDATRAFLLEQVGSGYSYLTIPELWSVYFDQQGILTGAALPERFNVWFDVNNADPSLRHPLLAAGVGGGFASIVNNGVLADYVTFTRSSTATYFDSAGVMQTAAVDEPRIDYDPATLELRGLLVEEQRTNLLLRSQEFDSASWAKLAATVSANATTAPDGTSAADKIVETAVTDAHQCSQIPTLADNTTYTLSVFAKAAERGFVRLTPTTKAGVTANTYFNLSTGVVGTVGAGHTATIQNVGNGWYRCAISYGSSSGATSATVRIGVAAADNELTYAGNASSGIFVFGAQLEAGAFATSYIPTAGTAQTRAEDVSITTSVAAALGINEAEGTLFAEFAFGQLTYGSVQVITQIDDGTNNNRHILNRQANERAAGLTVAGGATQAALIGANPIGSAANKIAYAYKANDFAFCRNGGTVITDVAGTVPSGLSRLLIGQGGGFQPLNGWIKSLRYYPRRIPNATLQALTA